jgi:hypothetical protein
MTFTAVTLNTLRDKTNLKVFDNKETKRIFVTKTKKVIGIWEKICNEQLHNLYSSKKNI